MIVPIAKLQGSSLDWAVGLAEFGEAFYAVPDWWFSDRPAGCFLPACEDTGESPTVDGWYPGSDMLYGGSIVERERIATQPMVSGDGWVATLGGVTCEGPRLLVAAMRCYVSHKLGPEIDVPNCVLSPDLLAEYGF
jgi:hypothetical protein